ncbi:sigma-70 family RNA polymerase sigma factor [Bacillus sp. NPDC077411]|uniref:sigma-70 family RNA polymerase sigma factor n=1 Tax=Bacillus sp. NPDC077411 TaxID=3363947 RepID=UPI0037CA50C8
MKELIKEYKETLKQLEKTKAAAVEDKKIVEGMISDMEYALEWMRKAKQPGNKRGIERRAAYQREKACDPLIMQRYLRSTETEYSWDKQEKESVISEGDRMALEDALSVLRPREKEIYVMSRGYGLTQEKIANYLKVKRTTVQQHLNRAEEKIAKRINESIFCLFD